MFGAMFGNATPWSVCTVGEGDGATATKDAKTGRQHFVTHISGYCDEDSIVKILDGSTIVWEGKVDISAEGFAIKSPAGLCIPITPGTACSFVVVASTAECAVNGGGFTV